MKRIIIAVLLVVFSVMLVGCGNSAKKESTYTLDTGASQITKKVVITSEDDKVSQIKYTSEAAIPEYLFEKFSVKELEKQYEAEYINPKKDNKGIEYDITVDKDKQKLKVTITIDPTVADAGAVSKIGLENAKSLKKLEEHLKAQGFTLKKK